MAGHERYEELTVLAAVGELSQEEERELGEHSLHCADCRTAREEFLATAASMFAAGKDQISSNASHAVKSRVRHQLVTRFQLGTPVKAAPPKYKPSKVPAYVLFAVAVLVVGTIAGGVVASHFSSPAPRLVLAPRQSGSDPALEQKLEQYIAQASRAAQEAAGEKAANQEMRAQLSADAGRFAELERRLRDEEQQLHEKQATLDKAQEELSTTQSALTQAQTRVDTTTASLAAAGSALSDTEKALEEQKASIERERELLANGREVRDIMGARNLHIVDVYDTDGKGHTRRAFGRAFYTQGKSLIFYAFDLPAEKADSSKYAFYAWGKNSGSPSSATHGLGIFYHDDQAQRRWVMEFSDPKVLNEIDTVFVTLEPKNKALHTPTGKPILDAYFGSPANHP